MQVYNTYQEAKEAADKFFFDNFGYTKGAFVHSEKKRDENDNIIIDFHSLDDPAMVDTFPVKILINNRKIMHLENKATGQHEYFGSLVAYCATPGLPFHTVKRITEFPYERENFVIREGELLSSLEVKARKNNA